MTTRCEHYVASCPECGHPQTAGLGPVGPPSHPLPHRIVCALCQHRFPAFPPGWRPAAKHGEQLRAAADARYLESIARLGEDDIGPGAS